MKTYIGTRDSQSGRPFVRVTEDAGGPGHLLNHLPCHSPDGFEWGYGGSGPADLAIALLADADPSLVRRKRNALDGGAPIESALYQAFKSQVVARLPRDERWTLTQVQIVDWVTAYREAAEPKGGPA